MKPSLSWPVILVLAGGLSVLQAQTSPSFMNVKQFWEASGRDFCLDSRQGNSTEAEIYRMNAAADPDGDGLTYDEYLTYAARSNPSITPEQIRTAASYTGLTKVRFSPDGKSFSGELTSNQDVFLGSGRYVRLQSGTRVEYSSDNWLLESSLPKPSLDPNPPPQPGAGPGHPGTPPGGPGGSNGPQAPRPPGQPPKHKPPHSPDSHH